MKYLKKEPKIAILASAYSDILKFVNATYYQFCLIGSVYVSNNTYTITEVKMMKQSSTASNVDMNIKELDTFIDNEYKEYVKNKCPNWINAVIKNNANSTCAPSSSDYTLFDKMMGAEDWYIYFIINKKKEINVGFIDTQKSICFEDMPYDIIYPSNRNVSEIEKIVKNNLKYQYSYSSNYYKDSTAVVKQAEKRKPSELLEKKFPLSKLI